MADRWQEYETEQRAQGNDFVPWNGNVPDSAYKPLPPSQRSRMWDQNEQGWTGQQQLFMEQQEAKFNEKELPPGAVAWDEYGQPFYGGTTPYQEWQLRSQNNMTYANVGDEASKASWSDWDAPNLGDAWEQEGFLGLGKGLLAGIAETVDQANESVNWLLAGRPMEDEQPYEREPGEPTNAQEVWRNAMYKIKSPFMAVFEGVPYQFELGLGGTLNVAKHVLGIQEGGYNEYKPNAVPQGMSISVPPEQRFWQGMDWKQTYLEGAQSGRLLYTNWWNQVKSGLTGQPNQFTPKEAEYERILREDPNANPYFHALAFESPWAEGIGRAIFDPLNILEFGAKAVKGTVMAARAAAFWGNAMPNAARVIKAGQRSIKVAGKFEDITDANKLKTFAAARIQDVQAVRKAEVNLAKSKGVFQVTNGAKAHLLSQETATLTHWAVRMARDASGKFSPDNFFKIIEAIGMTANRADDAGIAQEGLQMLSRFEGWDLILTEPGTRAANLFADFSDNAAWYRSLTKAETVEDLFTKVDEKIYKTASDMFPTILDQVKANKKVSPGWHALAKTHDYIYNKGPYKYFNKVFSGMYLGLNPGYVARNYMQNTVQALVDEGIGGVIGWRSVDEVTGWLGDETSTLIPAGMREGMGVAGGEAATPTSKLLFGLHYGAEVEKFSSVKIFGKVVPQTMKKLLKQANIKQNLMDVFQISEDNAVMVERLLLKNKGNADAVLDELLSAAKDGYIKELQMGTNLSRDQISFMNEFNLWDRWYNIVNNAETAEDAAKSWSSAIDEILQYADDGVLKDVPTGIPGSPGEDAITDSMAAAMGKNISNEELSHVVTYHTANSQAVTHYKQLLTNYKALVVDSLANSPRMTMRKAQALVDQTLARISIETPAGRITAKGLLDDSVGGAYKALDIKEADPFRVWRQQVKQTTNKDLMQEVYLRAELDKFYGKETFDGNWKELTDMLWRGEERARRAVWQNWRDTSAAFTDEAVSVLKELGEKTTGRAIKDPDYTLAGRALEKARKFDSFMTRNEVQLQLTSALRRNKVTDAAFAWAKQYRLDYFDKAGRFVDKRLLNAVNKQLGTTFKSMDEMNGVVSFADMEKAILAQALGENLRWWKAAGQDSWDVLRNMVKGETMTADQDVLLAKLWDTLDEVNPGAKREIESALAERQALGGLPGQTQTPEQYNNLKKAIDEADQAIDDAIDEAQEVMRQIEEGDIEALSQRMVDKWKRKVKVTPDMTTWSGLDAPSTARQIYEQREVFTRMQSEMADVIQSNFNNVKKVKLDGSEIKRVRKAIKWTKSKVEEARRISAKVALEKRNFILHDYGKKRNFDLLLSYVMPYHFWYTRTYGAWAQRIPTHPGTVSAYLQYKRALEKVHADLPDFWKYSLNSNELLGLDSESPFYFNLDRSLNPMNGLVGVDFDDADKRTNWFNKIIDDLGKFGPSVYTPIALGIAYSLYREGNEEAAAKWAGRLIPQTAALKGATDILNRTFGMGGPGWRGGVELDPAVHLFSGGVDVWERGQIGRALGWAVENGDITEAEAQQAAMEGMGNDIFMNARSVAASQRSTGNLASFFMGASFRRRPQEDMQIDLMDREFGSFMSMSQDLDSGEFADGYLYFSMKYPFFNTVKLARRDTDERDRAYAYQVLGRIPPGQSSRTYELVGLDKELVQEFYDSRGDMSAMADSDREKFMMAIMDFGAISEVPDGANKWEWRETSRRYQELQANLLEQYGEAVVAGKDEFWSLWGEDRDKARQYLETNPEVAALLDAEAKGKAYDPLMQKYYNTFDKMRSYYFAGAYDQIYENSDPNIRSILDTYYGLEGQERKDYFKAHKEEIRQYWDNREIYLPQAMHKVENFARHLPEFKPDIPIREELPEDLSTQQEQIIEGATDERMTPEYYRWTWDQWTANMDPRMKRILVDWAYQAEWLPDTAERQLDEMAEALDIKKPELKHLLRQSMALGSEDYVIEED